MERLRTFAVARSLLCVLAATILLATCGNLVSMKDLSSSISTAQKSVPAISVSQGSTPLARGSGAYDFGSVVADNIAGNFAGSAVTFAATNTGGTESSLTVNGVSLSGASAADFALAAPAAKSLAYGESYSFTLTFDPAAMGSKTATVTVSSSDPDYPNYAFTITGTGQAFRLATVSVPAVTSFVMGYAGVGAGWTHTVSSISAFEMGTTEVTYDIWLAVKTWALTQGYSFENAGQKGDGGATATGQCPVTLVSWRDAIAWCNAASELAGLTPAYYADTGHTTYYKNSSDTTSPGIADISAINTDTNAYVLWTCNGYRLPTEQEWEYAARRNGSGSTQGDRVSGDTLGGDSAAYAWYAPGASGTTHAVGTKTANSLGIFDMSGNVCEWCWDWYATDLALSTAADWHGPDSISAGAGINRRVFRGGSAYSNEGSQYSSLHTNQYLAPGSTATSSNPDLGFRVVRKP